MTWSVASVFSILETAALGRRVGVKEIPAKVVGHGKISRYFKGSSVVAFLVMRLLELALIAVPNRVTSGSAGRERDGGRRGILASVLMRISEKRRVIFESESCSILRNSARINSV